ncbi:MAG: alpha/beta hydrolase [Myxococcota bacterium]
MLDILQRDPQHWIDLGHCQLPHWRIGTGPALVFVHGWPVHAVTFRNVVAALADNFTCHLIDLPLAGRSKWTDATPAGADALVDALTTALHRMELPPKFGLVGFDSGGGFARAAAATMPDRVSGLVLGNTETPGYHSQRFKLFFKGIQNPLIRATVPFAMRTRLGRWLMLRDLVADTSRLAPELEELFLDPLLKSPHHLQAALQMAAACDAADFDKLRDAHARIHAPVKLVWGTDDPWFTLENCKAMLDQFAGPVELVEIPGAKLFVHEEHPERFADEIRTHFAPASALRMVG